MNRWFADFLYLHPEVDNIQIKLASNDFHPTFRISVQACRILKKGPGYITRIRDVTFSDFMSNDRLRNILEELLSECLRILDEYEDD